MTGRAFTILYGPAGTPPGTVGDYIDDVAAGSVVVLDNGGRENATVWGDILTAVAHRRGIAGTVIDGACRDTHLSLELDYPMAPERLGQGHSIRGALSLGVILYEIATGALPFAGDSQEQTIAHPRR